MTSFRTAPTDKKGEAVQPLISPARRVENRSADAGFTLLEMLCVLAVLAILSTVALPALPRATSKARLESYAVATAALFKADRNAALRRRSEIATQIDAGQRSIRSGATGRVVRVPDDVAMDTVLSTNCGRHPNGFGITFFATGMSCGGVIALSRSAISFEVRVNWLTGGIEVVSLNRT
jgi:general secretion pathway protein H